MEIGLRTVAIIYIIVRELLVTLYSVPTCVQNVAMHATLYKIIYIFTTFCGAPPPVQSLILGFSFVLFLLFNISAIICLYVFDFFGISIKITLLYTVK